MNISTNFTLLEFLNSDAAKKKGIIEQFNTPSKAIIENMKLLAENVCEPIREYFGAYSPTSVYRCPRLNQAIKGKSNSKHLTAQAMDETFIRKGVNVSGDVFFWLLKNQDKVKWTKIIWEHGNSINPGWLHIEYVKQNEGEREVYVKYKNNKNYINYFLSNYYKEHKSKNKI